MMARIISLGVCLCFLINVPCRAGETVSSPFLTVSVDSQAGTWRCSAKDGAALLRRVVGAVVTGTRVLRTNDPNSVRTTSVTSFQDKLGSGKQVTLHLVDRPPGIEWQLDIGLYDQFAGLRLDWQLHNSAGGKLDLRTVTVADAEVETKLQGANYATPPVRALVNGFDSWDYSHVVHVKPSEMVRSSDSIALDIPNLIGGFLSATSAYGTFEYALDMESEEGKGLLRSTAEFNIIMEPGQTRRTDPLLVLFPSDLLEGLEKYGSDVGEFNGLHPKQYSSATWCSWYAGYGSVRQANFKGLESAVIRNAKSMAPIAPLGADTLRIAEDTDDELYGDWNFTYIPHGMGQMAGSLREIGMKPGLWFAPAWVSEKSEVFKQHPDWLQRKSSGELVTIGKYFGTSMHFFDASNPQVLEYLHTLGARFKGWGYKYVMIDFMYQFGLSDQYQDPHLTRAEIYHRALTTIREALGPDVYLLGCGAPQLASAGIVDGMRIGPDGWGMYGYENVAARYFEAGKWWINDPDALIATDRPIEEYRAWASLDSLSGSVLTLGDDFGFFSSEKMSILKRILPSKGMVGRPIDLFSAQPNNLWLLDSKIPGSKSGVLSLFNWGGNEMLTHRVNPAQLIQSNKKVLVYDFWNDLFMGEAEDELAIAVPPRNVRSLCLVETAGVPQVLEVSDYLPQMGYGLTEVSWSGEGRTLRGQSAGPSGDSYHIVFYVPMGYEPDRATVDSKETPLVKQPKNLWVLPLTGEGKPVEWSVHFR